MNVKIITAFITFLLLLTPAIGESAYTYKTMESVNNACYASNNVDGNILYVGGDGPDNYTSIQAAIDNASNGDTIFVYSGIYYENVVINKSINLVGEGRKSTIIDGMKKNNSISIFADNVVIDDFTIKNGVAGIYAYRANGSTITNNIVINSSQEGISIWHSNYCIVCRNDVINDTWGICLYGSYFTKVSYNNLIDNEENMHIYYWGRWPLFFTNRLSRNYWDNWIGIIPKPVIAFFYPLYPLIQFDWLPLMHPYNV